MYRRNSFNLTKSTFFDLLSGIQTPDSGKILIDGKDLKYNISEWQNVLGYTHQDTIILDDSLKNNIAIGIQKNINIDSLIKSIEISELSKFVGENNYGLDTHISEKGSNISGGQKQRIGIARALYKKSDLIIFDEATSALDIQTEEEVFKSIYQLNKNLTVIIVSHRVSSLQNCDEIYEVKEKKIVKLN